jgi:chemotaxis receptor (MCP) glutamine deamidase CheD
MKIKFCGAAGMFSSQHLLEIGSKNTVTAVPGKREEAFKINRHHI